MEPEPPLFGFHWNEASCSAQFGEGYRGLLTIIAHDLDGVPHVIGTGFIITRSDRRAWCVSAAHVFSCIRSLQSRSEKHAQSALAVFLPPPPKVMLDLARIQVISVEGPRGEVVAIEALSFDENSDLAVFAITLLPNTTEPYFNYQFGLEDVLPEVGDVVCILSITEQKIDSHQKFQDGAFEVVLKSRPIMRVGKVLEHYPEGHRLCKGPCIETSIPVFSGMSGGPALVYGKRDDKMFAFGVVCCDLDIDGESKQDRSIEGHSVIALLPCTEGLNGDGVPVVTLRLPLVNVSGSIEKSVF